MDVQLKLLFNFKDSCFKSNMMVIKLRLYILVLTIQIYVLIET